MAPKDRIKELEEPVKPLKTPKKAGVMALFYPDAAHNTTLLLILRKTYEGVHSNQIGFPGGKQEETDTDLLHTALRETREEVGVRPEAVEVVRSLTELYIPPSNFEVQPFLGLYAGNEPFVRQESEVQALVEVPFPQLMNDSVLTTRALQTSYARQIEVPVFLLEGHVVWGATAMMLSEIKELFKQVM